MEIRNVTAEQLEAAAIMASVRLSAGGAWGERYRGMIQPVRATRNGGRVWRIVLRTVGTPPKWGRRGFKVCKNGQRSRVPGAVCWHGHRAFMRALYRLAPHAVIISALARYNSAEDFEAKHGETGERPTGYRNSGDTLSDLCDCHEITRTACRYCGQDIEGNPEDGWYDRGNGGHCLPFVRRGELVTPPENQQHTE
jgi:hypothetical protein